MLVAPTAAMATTVAIEARAPTPRVFCIPRRVEPARSRPANSGVFPRGKRKSALVVHAQQYSGNMYHQPVGNREPHHDPNKPARPAELNNNCLLYTSPSPRDRG